jgi:hypothetical protein
MKIGTVGRKETTENKWVCVQAVYVDARITYGLLILPALLWNRYMTIVLSW